GFDKNLGSSFLISRNPAAFHRLSKSVNLEYNFSSDYLIVTTKGRALRQCRERKGFKGKENPRF
ncbi:MAG: hypothetical protein J5798_10985, partial [Spirochaetaceae bacterium]|nr:hypothetical protein [Spirochaetaceae bacterium]